MKSSGKKQVDPIPEKFASYEEAAAFWDVHDTMDYPEAFHTIDAITEFRERRYEIESDEDVAKVLQSRARQKDVSINRLASNLLRQQLLTAG